MFNSSRINPIPNILLFGLLLALFQSSTYSHVSQCDNDPCYENDIFPNCEWKTKIKEVIMPGTIDCLVNVYFCYRDCPLNPGPGSEYQIKVL
jgi:hypothetical protein